MSRSFVLVTIAGMACTVALQAQVPTSTGLSALDSSATPTPTFRSGVDLVSLTVTVTDSRKQLVHDLTVADFAVLEDGVEQTLSFFGADTVPLDLAVMIDCSASMAEKLPAVQRAATGLVRSLRPGDRAELIEFSATMNLREAMTADGARVIRSIESLQAGGETSLYSSLYVTLRHLAQDRPTELRRRAVVLLSDGEDNKSLVGFDDVLDLARRSGVSVYTVALNSSMDRMLNIRAVGEAGYAMRALAEATGARAFFPGGVAGVRAVYDEIAAELSSQYAIGYLPRNAVGDGSWRHVAVQVTARPGAQARARPGYFASPGMTALSALLKH